MKTSRFKNFIKNDDGVAAIEFAIVALVFIFTLVGALEFSRVFYIKNQLSMAIDKGERRLLLGGAINGSNINTNAETTIRQSFFAGNQAQLTLTIEDLNINGLNAKRISASYPFTFVVPLPFTTPLIRITRMVFL